MNIHQKTIKQEICNRCPSLLRAFATWYFEIRKQSIYARATHKFTKLLAQKIKYNSRTQQYTHIHTILTFCSTNHTITQRTSLVLIKKMAAKSNEVIIYFQWNWRPFQNVASSNNTRHIFISLFLIQIQSGKSRIATQSVHLPPGVAGSPCAYMYAQRERGVKSVLCIHVCTVRATELSPLLVFDKLT